MIYPVTSRYDVPLMVARGYASLSFLHSAARFIADLEVPAFVYHLGDFDPSGVNAGEKIEETLREMAQYADLTFERIAVNPDQIAAWNLRHGGPNRPTRGQGLWCGVGGVGRHRAEPMRDIVDRAIERHLPSEQLEVLEAAEESERSILRNIIWPAELGGWS